MMVSKRIKKRTFEGELFDESYAKSSKLVQHFILPALNNKTYGDLLKWDSKDPDVFVIKWMHKAKAAWSEDELAVFKAWDELKGRPPPQNEVEFVESKQRLRAAFRNVKSLQEVGKADGYRKYRLVKFKTHMEKKDLASPDFEENSTNFEPTTSENSELTTQNQPLNGNFTEPAAIINSTLVQSNAPVNQTVHENGDQEKIHMSTSTPVKENLLEVSSYQHQTRSFVQKLIEICPESKDTLFPQSNELKNQFENVSNNKPSKFSCKKSRTKVNSKKKRVKSKNVTVQKSSFKDRRKPKSSFPIQENLNESFSWEEANYYEKNKTVPMEQLNLPETFFNVVVKKEESEDIASDEDVSNKMAFFPFQKEPAPLWNYDFKCEPVIKLKTEENVQFSPDSYLEHFVVKLEPECFNEENIVENPLPINPPRTKKKCSKRRRKRAKWTTSKKVFKKSQPKPIRRPFKKPRIFRPNQEDSGGCRLVQDFILPALDDQTFGELLKWSPYDPSVFMMKWTHKAKSSWCMKEAAVFMAWDEVKGRPPPTNRLDFVDTKQRMRAAFRNDRKVKLLKYENGYRHYRVLDLAKFPDEKRPKFTFPERLESIFERKKIEGRQLCSKQPLVKKKSAVLGKCTSSQNSKQHQNKKIKQSPSTPVKQSNLSNYPRQTRSLTQKINEICPDSDLTLFQQYKESPKSSAKSSPCKRERKTDLKEEINVSPKCILPGNPISKMLKKKNKKVTYTNNISQKKCNVTIQKESYSSEDESKRSKDCVDKCNPNFPLQVPSDCKKLSSKFSLNKQPNRFKGSVNDKIKSCKNAKLLNKNCVEKINSNRSNKKKKRISISQIFPWLNPISNNFHDYIKKSDCSDATFSSLNNPPSDIITNFSCNSDNNPNKLNSGKNKNCQQTVLKNKLGKKTNLKGKKRSIFDCSVSATRDSITDNKALLCASHLDACNGFINEKQVSDCSPCKKNAFISNDENIKYHKGTKMDLNSDFSAENTLYQHPHADNLRLFAEYVTMSENCEIQHVKTEHGIKNSSIRHDIQDIKISEVCYVPDVNSKIVKTLKEEKFDNANSNESTFDNKAFIKQSQCFTESLLNFPEACSFVQNTSDHKIKSKKEESNIKKVKNYDQDATVKKSELCSNLLRNDFSGKHSNVLHKKDSSYCITYNENKERENLDFESSNRFHSIAEKCNSLNLFSKSNTNLKIISKSNIIQNESLQNKQLTGMVINNNNLDFPCKIKENKEMVITKNSSDLSCVSNSYQSNYNVDNCIINKNYNSKENSVDTFCQNSIYSCKYSDVEMPAPTNYCKVSNLASDHSTLEKSVNGKYRTDISFSLNKSTLENNSIENTNGLSSLNLNEKEYKCPKNVLKKNDESASLSNLLKFQIETVKRLESLASDTISLNSEYHSDVTENKKNFYENSKYDSLILRKELQKMDDPTIRKCAENPIVHSSSEHIDNSVTNLSEQNAHNFENKFKHLFVEGYLPEMSKVINVSAEITNESPIDDNNLEISNVSVEVTSESPNDEINLVTSNVGVEATKESLNDENKLKISNTGVAVANENPNDENNLKISNSGVAVANENPSYENNLKISNSGVAVANENPSNENNLKISNSGSAVANENLNNENNLKIFNSGVAVVNENPSNENNLKISNSDVAVANENNLKISQASSERKPEVWTILENAKCFVCHRPAVGACSNCCLIYYCSEECAESPKSKAHSETCKEKSDLRNTMQNT